MVYYQVSFLLYNDRLEAKTYIDGSRLYAGLGTHTYTDSSTPISARVSKLFDKVTAWNIKAHILGTSYGRDKCSSA